MKDIYKVFRLVCGINLKYQMFTPSDCKGIKIIKKGLVFFFKKSVPFVYIL